MVVVVRCALCPYRYDAVIAIFVLLEGQFLPKRIIDIHKQVGCIVKSLCCELRSYLGCQRERFGIVRRNQQYGQCVVGQLPIVRVAEEIKSFGATEFQCPVCQQAYTRICAIDGMGKSDIAQSDFAVCNSACHIGAFGLSGFILCGLIFWLTCGQREASGKDCLINNCLFHCLSCLLLVFLPQN